MERGKFVAVYGANNLGKSTALKGLEERLKCDGWTVLRVKYPDYSLPKGIRINAYLRLGNPEGLTADQAQDLYAQNRWERQPALLADLGRGVTVLAEDYVGTGMCWGQALGVTLKKLIDYNQGLLKPDLAILLDGNRFVSGIEPGHKLESDSQKWNEVRRLHQELAMRERWYVVGANQEPSKVVDDLMMVFDGVLVGYEGPKPFCFDLPRIRGVSVGSVEKNLSCFREVCTRPWADCNYRIKGLGDQNEWRRCADKPRRKLD
ncbi:MAG: hypothetical protein WCT01_04095 [Candidatus Shapirobacteria bacterium]|jgi:thymidylate kinase